MSESRYGAIRRGGIVYPVIVIKRRLRAVWRRRTWFGRGRRRRRTRTRWSCSFNFSDAHDFCKAKFLPQRVGQTHWIYSFSDHLKPVTFFSDAHRYHSCIIITIINYLYIYILYACIMHIITLYSHSNLHGLWLSLVTVHGHIYHNLFLQHKMD